MKIQLIFTLLVATWAILCISCHATCRDTCKKMIECGRTTEPSNDCKRRCEHEKWKEARKECQARYCNQDKIDNCEYEYRGFFEF